MDTCKACSLVAESEADILPILQPCNALWGHMIGVDTADLIGIMIFVGVLWIVFR